MKSSQKNQLALQKIHGRSEASVRQELSELGLSGEEVDRAIDEIEKIEWNILELREKFRSARNTFLGGVGLLVVGLAMLVYQTYIEKNHSHIWPMGIFLAGIMVVTSAFYTMKRAGRRKDFSVHVES